MWYTCESYLEGYDLETSLDHILKFGGLYNDCGLRFWLISMDTMEELVRSGMLQN